MKVSPFLKAIVGALAAGATALVSVITDDNVSIADVVFVVGAILGSFGIVYAVPNRPAA